MINPYTLSGLYEKGIIDYIPFELMAPTPVGNQMFSNPYLDMAKQGGLYRNYGQGDSFTFNGVNNSAIQNVEIGSQSMAGSNAYGLSGIGTQSNAGMNAFGLQGIGSQSNAGMNGFGASGIGTDSRLGNMNAWGGITDAKNNVKDGVNTVTSIYNKTPGFIKGLVSALIVGGTLYHFFKRGKKPAKVNAKKGFLSKLNPKNWFKSNKTNKTSKKIKTK